MRQQGKAGRGQRWLLALLCLLASFAFLGRVTGSGGSALAPLLRVTAAPLAGLVERTEAHAHSAAHAGHSHQPPEEADRSHPAPQAPVTALSDAAPNAPPHRADHGAHCPFCFTAAFALEAGRALLFVALPASQAARVPTAQRPVLAPQRGPQPRAPPVLG
ncbi:hypothetical protein GO986_06160 [Deinococcus sp. HMF7620]|uniref:DUF2946 domain-containing protein n=1 Tax=Deinococcus arboris TaxID=2682977 RepID=A0A7C9M5C8_9DEIO|nr:hypothetical protein [Deinococcus arboris]MVN86345.1 hypothetical protein [Deinococcus arboris]